MKWLSFFLFITILFSGCSSTRLPPKKIVKVQQDVSCPAVEPGVLIRTNRVRTGTESPYKYFGNQLESDVSLKSLKICDKKDVWNILEYDNFEQAVATLSPQKDIIVFVHGDGKLFSEIVERSLLLKKLYDANIIAFDYPSEDPDIYPGFRNFFNSVKNIKQSMPQFKTFLQDFERVVHRSGRFQKSRKTILFHSLGGFVLERAIKEKLLMDIAPGLFDNIILNASAVAQNGHAEWLSQIPLTGALYVTSNNHDFTLNGAVFITFNKMLGVGVEEPLAQNASYIDFSEIYLFEHNYFLMAPPQGNPVAKWFYDHILHGKRIDFETSNFFRRRSDIRIFDLIDNK